MKQLPHHIDQIFRAVVHHAEQRNAGDTWAQHACPILPHYPTQVYQ